MNAAEILILLALLVSWLEISPDSAYQFLDFYAGKAHLAQLAEARGYTVEAYDRDFGLARGRRKGKRSSMDINSNAGMTWLGVTQQRCFQGCMYNM